MPTISANDCGCCLEEEKAVTEVKLLVAHPLTISHSRDQGEEKKSLMVNMIWYGDATVRNTPQWTTSTTTRRRKEERILAQEARESALWERKTLERFELGSFSSTNFVGKQQESINHHNIIMLMGR